MQRASLIGIVVGALIVALVLIYQDSLQDFINPIINSEKELTLEKYSFPNLQKTKFEPSDINIGKSIHQNEERITARVFTYNVDEKKVSGVITMPDAPGVYPIIIMIRGYVDKEIYRPGIGTQRGANFFAKNDYIVLSLDFLGYGTSDQESFDALEARFQTYTTVLTLLSSLPNLNTTLDQYNLTPTVDKVALWGHSNGGQIAIGVLEITGKKYPTTLWAPVSKTFPDSILYFADEQDDGGTFIRNLVSDFESEYDSQNYTPTRYLDWIYASIQLHQGEKDDAVPLEWSNNFHEALLSLRKNITYYTYPEEDHNFTKGSWETVISRDLDFFNRSFKIP